MKGDNGKSGGAGRWTGAALFTIGMVMLVGVFALAAVSFAQVPRAIGGSHAASDPGLGALLGAAAARAGFLLVMAYVSSLVASKGLELYQAARGKG